MLTENVRRAAAEFGSRVAYVADDGWAVSYAELDRAADEVAAALRTLGLGERATVALVLESTVDYLALYLRLARIGAVTAEINPRLRPRETNACLAALAPDLVVASAELMDNVAERHPRHMISVGDSARSLVGGLRDVGAPPAEIAIVPTSDEVMGEIGVAVVVASDRSSAPSLESLREFGADRLTLSDPGP